MTDVELVGGGILALLILRTVFDFMKSKPNGSRIEDLWQWHKPNTEGRQTWKTPELAELLKVMTAQTNVLKELVAELKSRPCLK